jgi:hypothetical protein
MLGVHVAPDGNNKDVVKALRTKVDKWVANIRTSRANMEEVWTAIHRTIPFTVCYPLPAVTMTPQECKYIMAPLTKYGLPLAGIASTMPTAIRVGSINSGGLGVIDLYTYMGASQIDNLIINTWKKTPTGVLQEIAIEDLAMEIGISTPWSPASLLRGLAYASTRSWIYNVVQFALQHDITIDFQLVGMISPKRQGDETIMEAAYAYTTDKQTLISINCVRMALNVMCISDIATADGRRVDSTWMRALDTYPCRNDYKWPRLHHATSEDWRRWRRWLSSITRDQTRELLQPLGEWFCARHTWVANWDSFCTLNEEILYIRSQTSTSWARHIVQPNQRRRHKRYFTEYLRCSGPPEDPSGLKRVSYRPTRTYIEVLSSSQPPNHWTPHATLDNTWGPYEISWDTLSTKIQRLLQPCFLDSTRDLGKLFRDFARGTAVAVSDGSYLPDRQSAAAAWIIESACGTQWIMGSLVVPGSRDCYSSYRSELTGLLAISIIMKLLSGGCPQPRHVLVGCDGKAALQALSLNKDEVTSNTTHLDLISTIIDLWNSCTMKPYPIHIRGHQDESQASLTRLEKMNVLVDKLAKMTAEVQEVQSPNIDIPFMGMKQLTQTGTHITGCIYQSIYSSIVDSYICQYFETRLLSPLCTMDNTAFLALQHARSTSPLYMIKFMSKWWSNTLPTGKVMQRRQQRVFNRCPRCNDWGEDRLHILLCWDGRANIIRKRYMDTLQHLLTTTHTHSEIVCFIMEGLYTFFRSPNQQRTLATPEQWQAEQQSIGWANFKFGFIGNALVQKQQEHYVSLGRRNKGKQWASKIISHNWHLLYKLWLGRNEVLHQKEIINSLSGGALLDIEVERMYDMGYAELPPATHKWFRLQKHALLEKSVEYKKGWLLIIRTIRESLQIAEYSIFTSSRALRTWVGLPNP